MRQSKLHISHFLTKDLIIVCRTAWLDIHQETQELITVGLSDSICKICMRSIFCKFQILFNFAQTFLSHTHTHTLAMCKNLMLPPNSVKVPGGETFCQLLK